MAVSINVETVEYSGVGPAIHLAHPGIVMRPESDRNPRPRIHREEHITAAREHIQRLLE